MIGFTRVYHIIISSPFSLQKGNSVAYQGDMVTADRQDVNKTNARAAKVPESNMNFGGCSPNIRQEY